MNKNLLSPLLLAASLVLSALVLRDALTGLMLSDSQIRDSLRGLAREDVFGFGFWPFLVVVATLQLVLIGLSRATELSAKWILVSAIAAAFSLLLWAIDFQRIEAVWLGSGLVGWSRAHCNRLSVC